MVHSLTLSGSAPCEAVRTSTKRLIPVLRQTWPNGNLFQVVTKGITRADWHWRCFAPGSALPVGVISNRSARQAAGAAARNSMSSWRPNLSASAFGASCGCRTDL